MITVFLNPMLYCTLDSPGHNVYIRQSAQHQKDYMLHPLHPNNTAEPSGSSAVRSQSVTTAAALCSANSSPGGSNTASNTARRRNYSNNRVPNIQPVSIS